MRFPEMQAGEKIPELNEYIEENLIAIEEKLAGMPTDQNKSWGELNALFLRCLEL